MGQDQLIVTVLRVDGTSFEIELERGLDCPINQLRREAARVSNCHPLEVALMDGPDILIKNEILRNPQGELPVISMVRRPALTNDEALALKAGMESKGIEFAEGLTEAQLKAAEQHFGIKFPPELKAFYSVGLPIGERFPDWRDLTQTYETLIDLEGGVLFDVEHNNFWWCGSELSPSWGPMPDTKEECIKVAQNALKEVPRVVPIYAHRVTMSTDKPGMPVLSAHQTDIIMYGSDLCNYLCSEFGFTGQFQGLEDDDVFTIPFWGELG
jgi:hypothetical protein